MEIRDGYRYTPEHEWIRIEGEQARFGLSQYAVEQLGGITFIDLPEIGDATSQADSFAEVESVKAVSDIYAPASGEVVEVNEELSSRPELIDQEPYDSGWICRVSLQDPQEAEELMSPEEYETYLDEMKQ